MPTLLRTNLLLNPIGRIAGNTNEGPNVTVSYEAGGAVVTHTNLAAPGNAYFAVSCSVENGKTYYLRAVFEDVVGIPVVNIAMHSSVGSAMGTVTGGTRVGSVITRDWSVVSTLTGQARILLDFVGTGAGESYRLKQMIVSSTPFTNYFDGSTANSPYKTYTWTGTANASTSTESSPLARPAGEYSLADLQYQTFKLFTGTSGSTSDVEMAYLKTKTGLSNLSLNDLRFRYFKSLSGLSSGSVADHQRAVLAGQSEYDYYRTNFI